MQMTEAEYRQLKDQIDLDAEAETTAAIERIEFERVQNHQALDRVWTMMQRKAQAVQPQGSMFQPVVTNGNGHGEDQDEPVRPPFPLKTKIREFVQTAGLPRISQPVIYDFLWRNYRNAIAHRDQNQVKGQITNVLSKLSEGDDAVLEVVQEAVGGNPKIFRPKH